MKTALLTGGAGFIGTTLRDALLVLGWRVITIDLVQDPFTHERYTAVKGDISEREVMESLFTQYQFDVIFHLAAILTPVAYGKDFLWKSNVDGTRLVSEYAKKHAVPKVVFTSTLCLWGRGFDQPVSEDEPPDPIEIYGASKLEAEKILLAHAEDFDSVIIRCPPVIGAGRLGLLAILFEFIEEGRRVWVVGGGKNRFQFISGSDLADACVLAASYAGSDIFHIGSDNVKSFREVYESVAERAKTGARVASLPRGITLFGMKVAHALGLSPLGPYQYKMLSENFVFDTSRIKEKLHWRPTMTNDEMLWRAYEYYRNNKHAIAAAKDSPAHKRPLKMGLIRVLKWFS